MTSRNEAVSIALAGRCYLYKLLRRIFGDEPDLALLEAASGELTREALDLFLDDAAVLYLSLLEELDGAVTNDAETVLDRLKSEYTYLMLGPNKLPAPPWESVHVTKERLILQESTLKVRRAYLGYQFLPAQYPHVADDHIALELDFMAHLAEKTQEQFENGKPEELEKLLRDQKTFLESHLLVWIPDFAEQMQSSKTSYFYPQMAMLTKHILRVDHALLDELMSVKANHETSPQ